MILFGANSKKVGVEPIENTCTNCHIAGTMDAHVFQRYGHLFTIPMFPAGKYCVSQCNHCRKVLRERTMPPELKQTCNKVKAQTKTPSWTFAGTFLVFIVAMLVKNFR